VRALEWLDQFLADEGLPPQVPDLWRTYDQIHVHYSEIARFGVDAPLTHLEFIPFEEWKREARESLLTEIRARDEPQAGYWESVFEQVETLPPVQSQ
jgi:hypothetical protein